ncbi:FHA domain-containing protein [Candidatus Ferrigenium straubiae]|jgi:pSer/pThr/pTyr-binding forkhead associated (FHA) protein|uniref:FHA domain-containing protein n=1 Tax=Candidatus Ferrigenium straubiae TaxID=2919506 RepID=UPI003F4AE954
MAAKLILSMDGVVIKEYPLNKERMTIGRKAHNDIVIDNLAVSGEHAAIVTILHDSFLEDLDSTNGLEVNGVPTKKHFLQNNDLVDIGKYRLKYVNDQAGQVNAADFEKTMVLRAPVKQAAAGAETGNSTISMRAPSGPAAKPAPELEKTGKFEAPQPAAPLAKPVVQPVPQPVAQPVAAAAAASAPQAAAVQILTGPNAGKELELVKNLTTLGKPGVQVAVLTRRPHGYFITHVEGASHPMVNGVSLSDQPHQLNDHDVIELAGVKMEFYFKE